MAVEKQLPNLIKKIHKHSLTWAIVTLIILIFSIVLGWLFSASPELQATLSIITLALLIGLIGIFTIVLPLIIWLTERLYAKKMVSNAHNPYIAGPPIIDTKMFFGRKSDLEKITGLLQTGNFVMLTGPRRIGKTSLLHQLVYHLPRLKDASEALAPVLVDVEGVLETEFFHTVMEEIKGAAEKSLTDGKIPNLSFDLSTSTYPARVFSRDLQAILKGLRSTSPQPSRLVLLLDEMDAFNSFSLDTQSQLRRIFQRFTNQNFSVAVAGVKLRQRWAGESSPFYNMFVPVTLLPLSKIEARRLITEPVEGGYSYSDEAVTRIVETTLGLPHRIQQLCLETIHHLQTTSKSRPKIMVKDVNTVLQAMHWLDETETPAPKRVDKRLEEFQRRHKINRFLIPAGIISAIIIGGVIGMLISIIAPQLQNLFILALIAVVSLLVYIVLYVNYVRTYKDLTPDDEDKETV